MTTSQLALSIHNNTTSLISHMPALVYSQCLTWRMSRGSVGLNRKGDLMTHIVVFVGPAFESTI